MPSDKAEDTRDALGNGWLHSCDMGKKDEGGCVYIVDRLKDMINAAGLKILPAKVEQRFISAPFR